MALFVYKFRKTKFLTSNNAFVSHVTKLQGKSKHVIYIELCFKGDFLSNVSCLPEGLSVWCLWIQLFSTDIVPHFFILDIILEWFLIGQLLFGLTFNFTIEISTKHGIYNVKINQIIVDIC